MASIDEVFDQLKNVNSNLVQIFNEQSQVKAAVDAGTSATIAVRDAVNAANERLDVLIAGQVYTNQALFHLTQQADTMICALEHISRNTCGIYNEAHRQTGLIEGLREDTADLLDLARSANPAGAVALDKSKELRREIERCCPPPPEQPVCEYAPCPVPQPIEPPPPPQSPPPIH
jgi:hypothetical protein